VLGAPDQVLDLPRPDLGSGITKRRRVAERALRGLKPLAGSLPIAAEEIDGETEDAAGPLKASGLAGRQTLGLLPVMKGPRRDEQQVRGLGRTLERQELPKPLKGSEGQPLLNPLYDAGNAPGADAQLAVGVEVSMSDARHCLYGR